MSEAARYALDDFDLYCAAREFRKQVYQLIKHLPRDEKFCLDGQMRRAAISITNNIAEAHGRWYFKENIQFCRIARGSIDEIVDDLNICLDEQYGDRTTITVMKRQAYELIHRVNSYIAYLRKTQQNEA